MTIEALMIDKAWKFGDCQVIYLKGRKYNVSAAIFEAKNLPVKNLPLEDFNIDYSAPCNSDLRNFCEHVKMVNDADLSYPIILNEDGVIIDGRHRLAKALIEGKKAIKAVRFKKDPQSIWTPDDDN